MQIVKKQVAEKDGEIARKPSRIERRLKISQNNLTQMIRIAAPLMALKIFQRAELIFIQKASSSFHSAFFGL